MERYKNLDGNSAVYSYELRIDAIAGKFDGTSQIYVYSYARAGQTFVEQMKLLAVGGRGLNSFIQKNARRLYDR